MKRNSTIKWIMSAVLCLTLCISLLPTVSIPAAAAETTEGTLENGLSWKLNGDTLTISGTGAMPNLPSSTSAPWYKTNDSIQNIVIESGVTSIGDYAFSGCSKLKSVTIPDSVTSIGLKAFYQCGVLTSVTIPNSVTSIGIYAFSECGLTSVTIPNSVTSIGNYAFYDCHGLTSVTIPNSVTNIGTGAFLNCRSLMSVEIPNSVTSISYEMFKGCSGLTSVTIPSSVTNISNSAFYGCSSLTSVTIPDSVTSIGSWMFQGCSSLTSVTIPDSVTSIGTEAFSGCSGLTSVTIPNSVTSIGEGAFENCSSLTSVTAPCKCTVDGQSLYVGETLLYSFGNSVTVTLAEHEAVDTGSCVCGYNPITSVTISGDKTSWVYAPDATATLTAAITLADDYTATTTTYAWTAGSTDQTCTLTGLNAGDHSYICTVTVDGYKKTSEAFAVSVGKAASSVTAAPTPVEGLTYTGEVHDLVSAGTAIGGTMVYSLAENGEYSETIPAGTNAGDYTVYYKVAGDANHNDSAVADVTVTIGKAPLIIMAKNQGITYGMSIFQGTSNVIVTGLASSDTLTGITLTPSIQDVGHGVITPSDATISGSADNYDITYETGSLTISTASATPKACNMKVTNDRAGTYTFDLSTLLPDLDSGKSYGTVSYEVTEVSLGSYFDSNTDLSTLVSGSTLTLPIQAVSSTEERNIGTITVAITSRNYIFAEATITVTSVNRETPQGTPTLTPATITYGQALSAMALSGTMTDAQGNTVSGTFTWDAPDTVYTAGTHHAAWTFVPSDTANYLTVHQTSEITVNKAAGSGSVTMAGWTYGGTASDPVPTSSTNGTGSVTYLYKVKGADDSTYTATKPTNAGTYTVKATFAATANYTEATATADFTITGMAQTAPAAPEQDSKTYNSVTLKTIEANANGAAVEYSKDGGTTWQSSPSFTGLSASTKYSFAARYVAVGNYAASPASDVTEITTDSAPSLGGGFTPSTTPTQSVTVPISGDNNTIHVGALVSGDTATVKNVDLDHLDTVIGDHVDTGTVTIDFSGLDSSKPITTVELPSDVVKQIAEAVNDYGNDAQSLEIVLSNGLSIEFDAVALGEKAAQANGLDITISIVHHVNATLTNAQKIAVGDRPAYDINVTSGGKHISDMGGKITVHAPYELRNGEKPSGLIVYYVDDHGKRERCDTHYDARNKRLSWQTDHLSLYMLDYDEKRVEACDGGEYCPINAFTDTDSKAWYHNGVHYCIENDLMNGISDVLFAPNGTTTRVQIVTILWRLEGKPVVNYLMQFEDVAAESWYTEAVRWAASENIVGGYGNGKFGPNDPITRQQMAAILYRYCRYKGIDVSVGEDTNILSYTDAFSISEWAIPAMQWACGSGMIQGIADGDGMKLDPSGSATRAQIATILWRFCDTIMDN